MRQLSIAAGYKTGSGIQRYFDDYKKPKLPLDFVHRLYPAFIGKGQPPIEASEIWRLADLPKNFLADGKPIYPEEDLAELDLLLSQVLSSHTKVETLRHSVFTEQQVLAFQLLAFLNDHPVIGPLRPERLRALLDPAMEIAELALMQVDQKTSVYAEREQKEK